MGFGSKVKSYLRPGEGAPGERALVQKLDFFILTFCCLMYFLNYVSCPFSLLECLLLNHAA